MLLPCPPPSSTCHTCARLPESVLPAPPRPQTCSPAHRCHTVARLARISARRSSLTAARIAGRFSTSACAILWGMKGGRGRGVHHGAPPVKHRRGGGHSWASRCSASACAILQGVAGKGGGRAVHRAVLACTKKQTHPGTRRSRKYHISACGAALCAAAPSRGWEQGGNPPRWARTVL